MRIRIELGGNGHKAPGTVLVIVLVLVVLAEPRGVENRSSFIRNNELITRQGEALGSLLVCV